MSSGKIRPESGVKRVEDGDVIRTFELNRLYVNIGEVQCVEPSSEHSCYLHLKSGDYYEVMGDSRAVMKSMVESFGDGTRLAFYGADAIVSSMDKEV
jgi:hypothetical protein